MRNDLLDFVLPAGQSFWKPGRPFLLVLTRVHHDGFLKQFPLLQKKYRGRGDFAASGLEPGEAYRVEMATEGLKFDPATADLFKLGSLGSTPAMLHNSRRTAVFSMRWVCCITVVTGDPSRIRWSKVKRTLLKLLRGRGSTPSVVVAGPREGAYGAS